MSKREKYYINIEGELVEVSPAVYHAYYGDERRERAQEEKKSRNDVMSYDALDTDELIGLEAMADVTTPSMDDIAIANELRSRLYRALNLLPRHERELVYAIYFHRENKEHYAKRTGVSVRGLNKRLNKVLEKLRIIIGKISFLFF